MSVAMVQGGFNNTEEQADLFFRGLFEGFKRLHDEMRASGPASFVSLVDGRTAHFRITDLAPVLQTLQQQAMERERLAAQAIGAVPPSNITIEPGAAQRVLEDVGVVISEEPMKPVVEDGQTPSPTNGKPSATIVEAPTPRYVMSAAEIAAAAISRD